MNTDSTTLRNLINTNAENISELQETDEALSARITADSNNLVIFKAKMKTDSTTLRNLINTNTENISELQETDEALSARITADSNNLVIFKAKMKTDSTTLRNLINTNAENISELQETDEALSARITADSNNLVIFKAKMKTDSTTLRNLINTNTENISELQETDEALSARITADSNNLVNFKAKVKTDSATLRNLINANTDNITITNNHLTALQNRVNTFNTNVCDSVDACVKGIVSDTASALRGLIKDTDDKFANYYTKTQTDNNIHDTANTVREEMSAQLATKADADNVYSKADMDQKLGAKADTAILAKVAKTGSYNDLSDKPTLADVTANGNSAGNRQLKDVSDPTDAQDAVTKSYLAAQLDALASWFQHQLDSLWGVIEAQQRLLDSLINGDTTFTCGTSTVTDYDNNTYNTVQIGNQCWMKENMRATHYANGDPVPAGGSNLSYYEPYYYDYSSSGIPLEQRGYLYNWGAAMHGAASSAASPSGVQGICPDGWHVPSHAEWTEMTDYVSSQSEYTCGGNSSNNAKALASKEWWNTSTESCAVGNDLAANNATGFSAVPAGYFEDWSSSFGSAGVFTAFWSSRANEGSSYYTFGRDLFYSETILRVRTDLLTRAGYSVRCLRDENGGAAQEQPTATTSPATDTTQTSATLNGTVSNPGNVTVTGQGFEWKATTGGTYTAVDATGATMTYSLTGLTANTSYTYRAFVTTASGTSYGEEVTFTTLSAAVIDNKSCSEAPTVTDHEGNVYATVKIGSQCWMRDNLRTTTSPSTGTYLVPAANADFTSTGKQARWYGNDSATCVTNNYGLLYNWNAAVDTFNTSYGETSVNTSSNNAVSVTFTDHRRGICPAGWHLPSDAEWTTMKNYVSSQSTYVCVGGSDNIAKALASAEGWNTYTANCAVGNDLAANNATGFSAVPAGKCVGSSFNNEGRNAYFWSTTRSGSSSINAYFHYLNYNDAYVGRSYSGKNYGYSVRCLRD
jgi:uncharacterized protein (TIGR02145 family)